MPLYSSISTIIKWKDKWIAYRPNGTVLIISHNRHIIEEYVQDCGYLVIYR